MTAGRRHYLCVSLGLLPLFPLKAGDKGRKLYLIRSRGGEEEASRVEPRSLRRGCCEAAAGGAPKSWKPGPTADARMKGNRQSGTDRTEANRKEHEGTFSLPFRLSLLCVLPWSLTGSQLTEETRSSQMPAPGSKAEQERWAWSSLPSTCAGHSGPGQDSLPLHKTLSHHSGYLVSHRASDGSINYSLLEFNHSTT